MAFPACELRTRPCFPHNSAIAENAPTRAAYVPQPQKTDARLGRIVRLLTDHATVVVSGTKIADELKASRSEVWRLIQQLRSMGVEVTGLPATGYQLRTVPDLLLPEVLGPLLKGTLFGKHIQHYYKTVSTNTAALEAASSGAPEGTLFVAEEQTGGRGRGSHLWHSPRSTGVYCSVVLRPALPPSEVLVLSLAAGLAVQSAVREVCPGLQPDLKWPNDVLLDRRKFCGILAEMNAEATRVRYLVVGIGINANQTSFPAELRDIATSLRMVTGARVSRVDLAAALLKSLDAEYRSLLHAADARRSVLRRFQENSSSVNGCHVRVDEMDLEGVTEGLDDQGFLQVGTTEGLRKVISGPVSLITGI
jgi:BirA family biotin operon repressor/biotin-[acetyl-CoA-carboxylase] ligase